MDPPAFTKSGIPVISEAANDLGVALFIAVKDAYFFRSYSVEEKGGMRGNQKLRPRGGGATLLGKLGEESGMQEIFRFFDTDELWRLGTVEHCQVSKHLESAIRSKPRKHGSLEGCIFNLKQ